LLLPVLVKDRQFLKQQFRRADLDLRVVLTAVAIGVLLRMSWWSQLVAGISFGIYHSEDTFAVAGPVFSFACPPPLVLFLGLFVMAVMVPLVEEVTHRAYVQTALRRFGPIVAVAGSAVVFTVLHRVESWHFVCLAGIVLGIQYYLTGSLWSSLITHSTVNFLGQLDWRCLGGQWNPHASALPLWGPGSIATLMLLAAIAGIVLLLSFTKHRGG
jgi:membrane protease YdiL (CAAX protease family)